MQFQKAQRKKAKLRLALSGPSGSGKTFSALRIAGGLVPGGRIAMIDTEGGSGELYADHEGMPEYHVLQFEPPYSPDRAVKAIQAAKSAGFDVVIFDSLSHVWMGEGGLLEMVDTAGQGLRGNSFAAWKAVRPHEKKFLETLVRTDIHIIATMRTKTAWEITKDERTGKTKPVKLGLKPEQREGLEYEFTTVLDLAVEGNVASASKDRTSLFRGKFFVPGENTGAQLRAWLENATEVPAPQPEQPKPEQAKSEQPKPQPGKQAPAPESPAQPSPAMATMEQLKAIHTIAGQKNRDPKAVAADVLGRAIGSGKELTLVEASKVIDHLQKLQPDQGKSARQPMPTSMAEMDECPI